MLAPTAAPVNFDLLPSPEQQACSRDLEDGLKTFWCLVEYLHHAAAEHQPMDRVEEAIFRRLLVIGRWLFESFLDIAGPGDVGPTLTVSGDFGPDRLPGWISGASVPICRFSVKSTSSGLATATTG